MTREQFFEALRCDLKLLRKLLCFTRYHLLQVAVDDALRAMLQSAASELDAHVQLFAAGLLAQNVPLAQDINEYPPAVFSAPVPGRQCIFASNGVFIDTKLGFQTRDVPVNAVSPAKTTRGTYFLLEHLHEALAMNCELRLLQAAKLLHDQPDISVVEDLNTGTQEIVHVAADAQLVALKSLSFALGKYAYYRSEIYGALLN